MRKPRVVVLLGALALCAAFAEGGVQAAAPASASAVTLLVCTVPESVLAEILKEPVFQAALQVLADQDEEASFSDGVMVSLGNDSNQYQVTFLVTNSKSGGPGDYTQLVFSRGPRGDAFAYFAGKNDNYAGPWPAATASAKVFGGTITQHIPLPSPFFRWGPWLYVSYDCLQTPTNCPNNPPDHYGRFVHWERTGIELATGVVHTQEKWTFGNYCGCVP